MDRVGLTKAEQTEATTRRLLDIAREVFTRKGYAAASIEEIVTSAGVSRGALYHHFKSKEALFEAVFLALQSEVGERIRRSDAHSSDLWLGLLCGCREFLSACREPAVRRIVLQDAPAVLGPDAWRLADEHYSGYQLRERLRELHACGQLRGLSPDVVTALLNGALNDAALLIAGSETPETAFAEVCTAFEALIDGLRGR